ncbi:3-hydroxyisobutyryl-CoA hydrolase [Mariluticola halotolerans]|uniref:3-hydroxyisobutyryl-CoA hydrolase n=1 Tax=Mariluticola halotolerans TaxID=2909283 RepID=UPI0026E13919|nr:3-hydroxyisobutyryl-CoA hydrolase [Mariluticola halotolerans]UJQ93753.1 enoyl-CoA hydratase/isomerase family protein [Mariluticola halotolerans]
MSQTVLSTRTGNTGFITLNRPAAINALDMDMITAIASAFDDFSADDTIAAIIFEGMGTRGFCAGGDVRAVRQAALEDELAAADRFFAAEYALNGAIAAARKPVVALTDGVVMGGGIGLAGHARFRIATDQSRFAMPESAIGFFCDVGVNAILARAPLHRALAFLMSGTIVPAADALGLGLTDCVIPQGAMAEVRDMLVTAIAEGDVATSITNVMQAHGIHAGTAGFIANADAHETIFKQADAAAILQGLAESDDSAAAAFLAVLTSRCPTSLEVIVRGQIAARKGTITDVLANDLALARWMVRRPDFAEGVRAVLVDKDKNAQWQPATIAEVDGAAIDAVLGQSL